jgi:hypothetical protein
LDIGEPNRIEQRWAKWTIFSNVNVWFDSLCEFFIYFGFATVREVSDEENGELDFGENQPSHVASLDESVISLDNTACNKGGCPAMSLFDPYLQDAPPPISRSQELLPGNRDVRVHGWATNPSLFCSAYRCYVAKPASSHVIY